LSSKLTVVFLTHSRFQVYVRTPKWQRVLIHTCRIASNKSMISSINFANYKYHGQCRIEDELVYSIAVINEPTYLHINIIRLLATRQRNFVFCIIPCAHTGLKRQCTTRFWWVCPLQIRAITLSVIFPIRQLLQYYCMNENNTNKKNTVTYQ